ncbi:hypothetical protein K1719_002274 [Acacia pycnantha]|nr:hypothetical protein K1719_002274 [Acacia pycnantha]
MEIGSNSSGTRRPKEGHLNLCTSINGQKGRALVGRLETDKNLNRGIGRLSRTFIRTCVLLNILNPLLAGFWVPRHQRDPIWVSVRYERLQNYCYDCGRIGHEARNCKFQSEDTEDATTDARVGNGLGTHHVRTMEDVLVVLDLELEESKLLARKPTPATGQATNRRLAGEKSQQGNSGNHGGNITNLSLCSEEGEDRRFNSNIPTPAIFMGGPSVSFPPEIKVCPLLNQTPILTASVMGSLIGDLSLNGNSHIQPCVIPNLETEVCKSGNSSPILVDRNDGRNQKGNCIKEIPKSGNNSPIFVDRIDGRNQKGNCYPILVDRIDERNQKGNCIKEIPKCNASLFLWIALMGEIKRETALLFLWIALMGEIRRETATLFLWIALMSEIKREIALKKFLNLKGNCIQEIPKSGNSSPILVDRSYGLNQKGICINAIINPLISVYMHSNPLSSRLDSRRNSSEEVIPGSATVPRFQGHFPEKNSDQPPPANQPPPYQVEYPTSEAENSKAWSPLSDYLHFLLYTTGNVIHTSVSDPSVELPYYITFVYGPPKEKDRLETYKNITFASQRIQSWVIRNSWEVCAPRSNHAIIQFALSLNICRKDLINWSKQNFPNRRRMIDALKSCLTTVRQGYQTETSKREETSLLQKFEELIDQEENYWWQRSRISWLKSGDRNSKFFHLTTLIKRRRNLILSIKDDNGVWTRDKSTLNAMFTDYFSNLFSPSGPRQLTPALDAADIRIGDASNERLLRPVMSEEDNWIPSLPSLRPVTDDDRLKESDQRVASIIDAGILHLSKQTDDLTCNAITLIPLSRTPQNDHLRWRLATNGKYSVKLGYHLTQDSVATHSPPPGSSVQILDSHIASRPSLTVRIETDGLQIHTFSVYFQNQ